MHRTFNCGIGMVLVVAPRNTRRPPLATLGKHGVPAWRNRLDRGAHGRRAARRRRLNWGRVREPDPVQSSP